MFNNSRKLWLVAGFTALLIILVNLVWWVYYDRTETLLDSQLGRRLAAIGATGAMNLAPSQIDSLALGDFTTYIDISAELEALRSVDSLSEVFIIDDDYRYLATTSLEADSVYFLAALNGPYIDSLFFYGVAEPLVTESYRVGGSYLKSAFVSLFDANGIPQAVLGVEAPVDYFDALTELRRNLYFSSLLSVLAGVVFGIIFLLLQRSLNRAQERLFVSETHSHLGRMVAVVSHEIKNPLMIIRASAERLGRLLKNQAEPPEETGYIVEEVDRLNHIVTGYLDFAKGAGSSGSLLAGNSVADIQLDELFRNIKKHFHEKFPGEKVSWVDDEPCGILFKGYARILRQTLLNLLINGAEACRSAGKPIKLALSACDYGDHLEIAVTDYGPGITKRELKKIFTPFYTTRQTGSGLGLYLTKKLIEEMNGRLEISSEPGAKTEVVIHLPKQPKA